MEIKGLTVPEEALVVAAITRLRRFRGTKSTPHEQVLEIVAKVRRCCAVLEGLGEIRALYSDYVTMAVVAQSLPSDSQERWYYRPDAHEKDPYRRAQLLVKWLETESLAAAMRFIDEAPAPVVR